MEMAGSSNALDIIALREDLKYMVASNVNVSNFVSVKLMERNNYKIWKAQMLCLIESQLLLHIINDEYPFPEDKGVHMIAQYDQLVKGWIFASVNEKVLKDFVDFHSAREVWRKLESLFDLPIRQGDSLTADDVSTPTQDLKYIEASNVNVSNFVSVKLSGCNNYNIWKAQMVCFIESQMLLHIINEEHPFPEDKGVNMISQYDTLVKGWLFGSMNESMLNDFEHFKSARDLWRELESIFDLPIRQDSIGCKFEEEFLSVVPEIVSTPFRKNLYEAAVEGCWWKAKSILKIHKNAAAEKITANGNTILHLAVEMGHDYFLEKLLDFLKEGKDVETKNDMGRTALHIAAVVGNTHAAQLLVQKRKELLVMPDRYEVSPLESALSNIKLKISAYLLKAASFSELSSYSGDYQQIVVKAICVAISTKQYDLARTLLETFPECAGKNDDILKAITITFPTDLGFTESFINPSFNYFCEKTSLRGSLLFHYNILDKCVDDISRAVKICNDTCWSWLEKFSVILLVPIATFYPGYQLTCLLILVVRLTFSMLYFLLWKVLAVFVRPIKNIETRKKEYQEAKEILILICNQMGKSNDGYSEPILEAVRQDAYEVVDEILFISPYTINCKDEEGHNIIQVAIKNRSEKVYNLIHYIIERMESCRIMKDSSRNNLAHLAARLAPSAVLDRMTGAALQLQRELIWREEVEKLMFPIELTEENIDNETPAMVFTKAHKDLLIQGGSWMKITAKSCSITTALIVTVVFAAAITVPGGSNQQSGIPVFKKEIAFIIFAVSNAFSLFTAATALLLFLSILTARFSERDFLVSLPRRLIFGLSTLFLSTIAMIVAFGAILFLVFCDQRPWMLSLIFGFACLPISVIVNIKLPLLADLIHSTYFPVFGKQSYLESCKINRKNTIFTE